jgi:hypothetical protein
MKTNTPPMMKQKIILCLALVLSGGLFGCSTIKQFPAKTHSVEMPQNISERIELEVPKLKCFSATNGTAPFAAAWTAWNGGEQYMQAAFYLWENPRYHPVGEFPREPATPLLYADMEVVIVLCPSADDAQLQVHKSLSSRQATFQPEQIYKGGTLYQYCDATGGVHDVIYQSHRFIVEIDCYSQNVDPLTMKVLDATLAELKP